MRPRHQYSEHRRRRKDSELALAATVESPFQSHRVNYYYGLSVFQSVLSDWLNSPLYITHVESISIGLPSHDESNR